MVKSMVNDFYTEDNVGVGIGVELRSLGLKWGRYVTLFIREGGVRSNIFLMSVLK